MQRHLMGPPAPLDHFRQSLTEKQQRLQGLLVRLHEAADGGRWREALEMAEAALVLAPQHLEARRIRTRAWQTIEPVTVVGRGSVIHSRPAEDGSPQRFFLWIDGVGGYLLCLSPHVTLGHAALDAPVDVPLAADVSRLHATITRDQEGGYLLEAPRPVQVNGQAVTRWVLQPGDRLTLGASCQLQFHKPAPLSASARLDFVSGHRSLPGIDGVLLMADTLVLGPEESNHVRLRDLKQPLVFFRSKDGLGVRSAAELMVDGQRVKERACLESSAHVSGEDFSLAIEPARTRG
jgi:FHA domain-containing protein